MSEKLNPPKPKSFIAAVKDFCAPIGQPSWTREKLDEGAEKLNSCLRAASGALDSAFNRIDSAIEKHPELPTKVVSGMILGTLLVLDANLVRGTMDMIAAKAPVQGITDAQGVAFTLGTMTYLSTHYMLARLSMGLSPIEKN